MYASVISSTQGRSNAIVWHNLHKLLCHEMRKNDQQHRISVVASDTKDCVRVLGRGTRSKNLEESPHHFV